MRSTFIDRSIKPCSLESEPTRYGIDHMRLLFASERATAGDPVPLREAAATAGRRCMLGYENRVPTHWRLLAIVDGLGGRQPLGDEVAGMVHQHVLSFGSRVGTFVCA